MNREELGAAHAQGAPRGPGAAAGDPLLVQELRHRIQNIFAVVSSVVALSGRSHPGSDGLIAELQSRIRALSLANLAVGAAGERSVSLADLITPLLAAHASWNGMQIRRDVDDVHVGPVAAGALALVFQELVTNSAKYGALSAPGGLIELKGARAGQDYVLSWVERGGPEIASPPLRAGFGSTLIARAVTLLGGKLDREWRRSGLAITLRLPVARLEG